jgi:A/G-specific adenine glycosylase
MLLRRTRSSQAELVIDSVLMAYSTPFELAGALLADLQALMLSAGLVGRSQQLVAGARMIVDRFEGHTPTEVDELQLLPGVGPYVASAVAAAAAGTDVVLTDTNTVRVAMRVAGMEIQASDIRRQRAVQDAIGDLFGGPVCARLWWGTIDLAHAICTSRSQRCDECPIVEHCSFGSIQSRSHTTQVGSLHDR